MPPRTSPTTCLPLRPPQRGPASATIGARRRPRTQGGPVSDDGEHGPRGPAPMFRMFRMGGGIVGLDVVDLARPSRGRGWSPPRFWDEVTTKVGKVGASDSSAFFLAS